MHTLNYVRKLATLEQQFDFDPKIQQPLKDIVPKSIMGLLGRDVLTCCCINPAAQWFLVSMTDCSGPCVRRSHYLTVNLSVTDPC